jgi:multicomponent Na+:H+ antiporter subunit D
MIQATSFIHPSLGFLALALALPFFKGDSKYWRWLLLLPPLIAVYSVFAMQPSTAR